MAVKDIQIKRPEIGKRMRLTDEDDNSGNEVREVEDLRNIPSGENIDKKKHKDRKIKRKEEEKDEKVMEDIRKRKKQSRAKDRRSKAA